MGTHARFGSELIGLRCDDVHLATGAHVACHDKGRKNPRIHTPMTPSTIVVLASWLRERDGLPEQPLFPSRRGSPLCTRRLR